jgi:transcriptional regulator GlxA family with amidase domain
MKEKIPGKDIQLALSYINAHLDKAAMTVNEIAENAHVTQRTIERRFKKWKGISVVHYLRSLRLEEAKRMLIETDEQISDIALSCGFEEISYFDRAFYKQFCINPKDCRNKSRV